MLTLDGVLIEQGDFRLSADFQITAGSRVAILGPSGAGKSTFLNALAGFVEPVQGKISWGGNDITNLAPGLRPLSVIFQDNNLFPHLSAYQNVAIGVRPSMRMDQMETNRVRVALDRVGLGEMVERKPATLSGGQQGRVALARVLVRDKPLMLLDEPFSALGPALKKEMLDLVSELVDATGATLLMVTHDPDDAVRMADQTVFVADGVAQAPQGTDDLLADPPAALRNYLG